MLTTGMDVHKVPLADIARTIALCNLCKPMRLIEDGFVGSV